MPRYSVVIPAHNACSAKRWSLKWTILQLLEQDYRDFEIVIAASSGDDETLEFADRVSAESTTIPVSVVANGRRMHRAQARNRAASTASGRLLVFMDDDCVYAGRDLFSHLDQHDFGHDFACGAKRRWLPLSWSPDAVGKAIQTQNWNEVFDGSLVPRGVKRKTGKRDLQEFSFVGHFGVVPADLFSLVGGFDEAYEGWGFEDSDLMLRLFAEKAAFVSLFDTVEVLHLTHSVDRTEMQARASNGDLYAAAENRLGLRLYVDRLFGVFDSGPGEFVQWIEKQ